MASTQMHNLTTLIKRLEAATTRLEDMAALPPEAPTDPNGASLAPSQRNTPAASSPALPAVALAPTLPSLPPAIEGFDEFLDQDVKKFVSLSEQIGEPVSIQAANVEKAFKASRKFILVTTKAKKPDLSSQAYMETLKDLQETLSAVDGIKVANRGSPLSNHLAAIAEGVPMLGWVAVEAKPQDYVKEMMDAAHFYGNRVVKEYKEKDNTHVEWIQSYYGIGRGLITYILKHYPHGMTWNNKDGIDAAEALRQIEAGDTAGPPASGGAPPPPPPPPPLPKFDTLPAANGAASSGSDMGAVFGQLSRGSDVTSGLRKVDTSQMTHKNPSLRTTSSVPARSDSLKSTSSSATAGRGKSPIPSRKPESLRTKKPARTVLESNKWYIENHDDPGKIIEIQASLSHSILITKCNKTTIRVYGKANAISVDSSSNVSLIVESLVSSIDVIKTAKFEIQVLGSLPAILLDQVDTSNIYLGPDSLGTEVLTSKCTAINVNVPGASEEDDYKECALPEQIKTVIRNGTAMSEIVEHAG